MEGDAAIARYADLFERLYGRRPEGENERLLCEAEQRLGCSIPPPLRALYEACGREESVMASHNRFLAPSALEESDGRLLFCEENQAVCVWGAVPGEDDPVAEVANVLRDGALEWHSEELRLGRFLEILVYLQTAWGGFEHTGDLLDPSEAMAAIRESWEAVVCHQGLTIYERSGALITALEGQGFLTGAARTEEDWARLEAELGFESS